MKIQISNYKKIAIQLIIVSMALFSWLVGVYVLTSVKKSAQEEITQQVSEQVKSAISDIEKEKSSTNYPDFNSLSSMQELNLISNFSSWTPNAAKDENKVMTKIVLDKGTVAEGYIYIKASVEGRALSRWESIYLQMNYRGGHLLRSKSLPMPSSDKTELLLALDDISYVITVPYRENDEYSRTNWLNLFQDRSEIRVDAFISSLKPAEIEKISLYYSCSDGSECLLSIKE